MTYIKLHVNQRIYRGWQHEKMSSYSVHRQFCSSISYVLGDCVTSLTLLSQPGSITMHHLQMRNEMINKLYANYIPRVICLAELFTGHVGFIEIRYLQHTLAASCPLRNIKRDTSFPMRNTNLTAGNGNVVIQQKIVSNTWREYSWQVEKCAHEVIAIDNMFSRNLIKILTWAYTDINHLIYSYF